MAVKKPMNMADRVRQKAKEAEFQGGSSTLKLKEALPFFKPKKGNNELIFIPFTYKNSKNLESIDAGEEWFRLQVLMHYKIGVDEKNLVCPRSIGKKCPICEHRGALISQGKDNNDPEVKELNAKKRELYYIIDLTDEKLKLMETSYFTFGQYLEEEIRESNDDLVANFATPGEGAIVTVRMREETMGRNKFLEAGRFEFDAMTKQDQALMDDAIEQVEPLDGALIVLTYDEIKGIFYDLSDDTGGSDDADDDSDDDEVVEEAPRRRRATQEEEKPTSRRSAKKDEEKPTSRRSAKKDDDADDADDADEAPAPRRRSAAKEEKPTSRRSAKKDDADDSDDEPAKAPSRRGAKKEEPAQDCSGGGTFGEDCDTLDFCEECPEWDKCRDLADELGK